MNFQPVPVGSNTILSSKTCNKITEKSILKHDENFFSPYSNVNSIYHTKAKKSWLNNDQQDKNTKPVKQIWHFETITLRTTIDMLTNVFRMLCWRFGAIFKYRTIFFRFPHVIQWMFDDVKRMYLFCILKLK